MIRPSAGTAKVLGFNDIKMETPPTCAYLMIGEGCWGTCAYCAQSSVSKSRDFLSRITWKPMEDDQVFNALAVSFENGELGRACLQVTRESHSLERTIETINKIKKRCDIPLCVSINGLDLNEMGRILEAGADKIAISFDAATAKIYREIKGEGYEELLAFYEEARRRFPGRIVIHLICGLGETEREMVEAIEGFYLKNTPVSLFAFTPVHGTPMAAMSPPPLSSYRRVQTAHFIIRENKDRIFNFDMNGRILFSAESMDFLLTNIAGEAFQTFGCSHCNRPLYNERPGQVPYNYPGVLTEEERIAAIHAMYDE